MSNTRHILLKGAIRELFIRNLRRGGEGFDCTDFQFGIGTILISRASLKKKNLIGSNPMRFFASIQIQLHVYPDMLL